MSNSGEVSLLGLWFVEAVESLLLLRNRWNAKLASYRLRDETGTAGASRSPEA